MGKKIYSVLLCIVIYLISSSNFYYNYIPSYTVCLILEAIIRLAAIIGIFIIINKDHLPKPEEVKLHKPHIWFLPFFLIPLSNLLVNTISNYGFIPLVFTPIIGLDIFIIILTAFAEELCFRAILLPFLGSDKNKFRCILFSSLIFGAVHLLNISSVGSIPSVLLQVLYSTGIGFVTSLMYVFGKKFSFAFIFHFLFNLMNGFVANYFIMNQTVFYIVNVAVGIIYIVYGIFVYKHFMKTEDHYYVS